MRKKIVRGGLGKAERSKSETKTELDLQTSYLTLLPHMEEGFSTGYQSRPGIVNDTNQKPHEWLENVAKYMQTQGGDVGYAIPDVLAGEQQMRRLMRLPHEEAMRHQEMLNWRAVMAILLLWDGWEKDDAWPQLDLEEYIAQDRLHTAKSFEQAVKEAMTPHRAAQGLQVFVLTKQGGSQLYRQPLCLLSRSVVLMPAANIGDVSQLLPSCVRWYDRKRKRFLDPVPFLVESDRARLVGQLRLLSAMNEQEELGSLLYSSDAAMCSPLEHFIDDLLDYRSTWRERINRHEERAIQDLYVRALAVFGMAGDNAGIHLDGLTDQTQRLDVAQLRHNLLISSLMPKGAFLPDCIAAVQQRQYVFDGIPFARASASWLLEPTNHEGEAKMLNRLAGEAALLCKYSPQWNAYMAQRFAELYRKMCGRVGASEAVQALLKGWSQRHAAFPTQSDRNLSLYYPIEGHPQALGMLVEDLIGMEDIKGICDVFSDCLLVMEGAICSPYEDAVIVKACRVQGEENHIALPPLSPWLCAWLMDHCDESDPYAPILDKDSISFVRSPETGAITASFRIRRRSQEQDALLTSTITFSKTYQPTDGVGGMMVVEAQALPFVAVWPNVRFAETLWRQYFVYTHRPEVVDIWIRRGEEWVQGVLQQTTGAPWREDGRARTWQTAATDRFPSHIVLRRGGLSLGGLLNERPREQIKHDAIAVAGVDFGSISTTVMMRQGDKVQPAAFPHSLHGRLLVTHPLDEKFLVDELLPEDVLITGQVDTPSTYYSVMDMFTDEYQIWNRVLIDGHIYFRRTFADLMQKSENTLYYDMKWGEEPYILHCMRLFLKQTMLQASLSARLSGAPSLSWRVSMPNALPLPRQEAYLEMMRGLAQEVAAECGMPLTLEIPSVLYATENQADGLYFRSRNEVNVRNGYVNMDIGGGTTDVSLWLNNAQRATVETSLTLGCRQMLFDSISMWHLDAFVEDFSSCDAGVRALVEEIAQALTDGGASTRGRQKSMFLLDDFFARYALDIRQMMAKTRSQGRISYLESLLLFNISFLFHLCARMLNRCWQDENTREHLKGRMEICIAGNGGQLLKAFDDQTRDKLCRLIVQGLTEGHPVRELYLVQSRNPKQEVAIGLVSDDQRMRSTIHGDVVWTGQEETDVQYHREVMHLFPVRFFSLFPQAAERLLPTVLDQSLAHKGVVLTQAAAMELDTILDNEFFDVVQEDYGSYVRCFTAMKKLWRV